MASYEILNFDNCYICNEFMGSFRSDLTVVTGYSEKAIYELIELFTNTPLSEEIIAETGVCQNCFIRFNEYDEHQTLAETIQSELVGLMNNKLITMDEETDDPVNIKKEIVEELTADQNTIEYEQYEGEEIFMSNDEHEGEVEAIQEEFGHYEIIVDDTKENVKKLSRNLSVKSKPSDYIVLEMDGQQKAYQCDICFKAFKDKSKLRTHREIHTDERNVICPVCQKGFKTMNCLRNHKRLHVPERTYYNCDQCEKKYTQKVQLKKHIEVVHMMRRDFTCNTCGASFGTNSVLKMHILSHTDFRAEKCEICGFGFHTKAKLRRHMKSHTGERNYECTICSKKFLYSYNVIAHIRNVHEKVSKRSRANEVIRCRYCSESFYQVGKLNEHLLSVHHVSVDHEIITEDETIYEYEEKQEVID